MILKVCFAVATVAAILIVANENIAIEWTSVFEVALYVAGAIAAIILAVLVLKAIVRAMYRAARATVIFAWRLVWFLIVFAPSVLAVTLLGTDDGPVLLIAGLTWAGTMLLFTRPRIAANGGAASTVLGGKF